jgi:hypothetical protein
MKPIKRHWEALTASVQIYLVICRGTKTNKQKEKNKK